MDKKKRERQIKDEYGERAQMVTPYKPNRAQRRAQEAARKQQKAKREK